VNELLLMLLSEVCGCCWWSGRVGASTTMWNVSWSYWRLAACTGQSWR